MAVLALARTDRGLFEADALAELDRLLASLEGDALSQALWDAALFAGLQEGNGGELAPVAGQMIGLLEKHGPRLPQDDAPPSPEAARDAAARLGLKASLQPVGSEPAGEGSVRGLGVRMLGHKKP